MEIAPGIDASEWKRLDLASNENKDWQRAIHIFRSRITGRYLEAADLLVEIDQKRLPRQRRFGFAVLAIDCLLVETLQAFIEGRTDTKNHSEEMFVNFLTSRQSFNADFKATLARKFYKQFRCGILHQAETTGQALVRSVGPLLRLEGNKMTLNRNEFHSRLKKEFDQYLKDLALGRNEQLRSNLRTKMDFIVSFG